MTSSLLEKPLPHPISARWIVRVPKDIIGGHGGLWSDNSVAMLGALFRVHFPLTEGRITLPPRRTSAPKSPDQQELNQDKLR